VKEGDHVKEGDVLIVLDDSQARSEFEVLSKQQVVLTATVARLTAELNHAALATPQELASRLSEPEVQAVWTAQTQQFNSRRTALDGQRKVIGEKINQLKEQIVGNERQVTAFNEQISSVKKELESIAPLVDKGLIAQPRKLQLERTAFGLQGQIAETTADIARAKQAIAEQSQQIAQLDNDRSADVTKDLRDTQALLLEVTPKLVNAKAVLSRMDIRSPYTGQVVGLNVFAVGAVIQRGEKILDIVPDEDDLTVEAQIAVEDISEIHPGMLAEVHLTSYKQRITPMVHGDLIQVSADRLTDNRTGQPYYTALVRIHQDELKELPNVHLYPGMPARVMIPTVERTAFDYLVGPLVMSFNSAFRQK
jgi:HlyD family type I secretion membrane fusion protein